MRYSFSIVAVALTTIFFFGGGVATSSIAEGKKKISAQAKEKAIYHQEKGSKYDDEGDYASAVTEYIKSLEYDSEDPNTLFNLGVVYLKINKAEDGVAVFEKLSKLLPKDVEVMNLLGVAYSGSGKKTDAISAWERSLKMEPNQPKVKNMITELKTASVSDNKN